MSIKLRLIFAFSVSIVGLIVLSLIYQESINRVYQARHWVEHSQLVLEKLENVFSLCKDLEVGERGFVITHQDNFLEPYERALTKIGPLTSELRTLTVDNPKQQRRLDRLADLESAKIAFATKMVELVRTHGAEASVDLTATQQGKRILDSIRALVSEMEDEERDLLEKRTAQADNAMNITLLIASGGAALLVLLTVLAGIPVIVSFSNSVRQLQEAFAKIGKGELEHRLEMRSHDEFARLGAAFNEMAQKLKTTQEESSNLSWLNSSLAKLGQILQGDRELQAAAQKVLAELASAIGSRHGMFYAVEESNGSVQLSLISSYAHHERKNLANRFDLGQGLVGQCGLERQTIVVSNAPDDYIRISSGTGEAHPTSIAVVPIVFENELAAVIEQASFQPFNSVQLNYLEHVSRNLGVILNSIRNTERTEKLLLKEQQLTEELQSQQEELTESNSKLESLARSLQASEEELKQQQEELQQTNEELEERSLVQTTQNAELERKNAELEDLRRSMEEKASQLSVTSKYKSEFLSNMSHELRTPLNSLLILSKVLFENVEGNLTEKQVEFARTIHSAGSDLLVLIDDVLDISKIEAGAMSIDVADEPIRTLCDELILYFEPLAKHKQLELTLLVQAQTPQLIKTDGRRLQQILRNLLSNAIKFTENGSVSLTVSLADGGWHDDNATLSQSNSVICFCVGDTGIGIAEDKQHVIFEAFQQADGTTSRRFGGTGLGLAISKELARLLGGEIQLDSVLGKGSAFKLYLPAEYGGAAVRMAPANKPSLTSEKQTKPIQSESTNGIGSNDLCDDRADISAGDRILLVVQADIDFARQVIDAAHISGFKVVCASQGNAAFNLVRRFKPDAISVDVSSPGKDGWIFLDRLKRDRTTRHIPVHVICDADRAEQARRLGAVGCSIQPASSRALIDMVSRLQTFLSPDVKRLLIIEDNDYERKSLVSLIEGADVEITSVSTGREALEELARRTYDCMILDLGLPDIDGFELLKKVRDNKLLSDMRIIIHTARNLTEQQETELRRHSQSIIVKGNRSNERLLDETTLFLHRVETDLPAEKRKVLDRLHLKDPVLSRRNVLIVDDDMRHVFAITSLLEQYDMQVIYADNGKQALELLSRDTLIDLVLMDVMMPEMDGYESMQSIRRMDRYKNLPIIALTAKAMKGDREQCIAAGASDYLAKPVDSDQLLSLMRVWLY